MASGAEKSPQKAPKRDPGGTQIDAQILVFFGAELCNEVASKKGRQGIQSEAGPGPGGTLLDHESVILRYLGV